MFEKKETKMAVVAFMVFLGVAVVVGRHILEVQREVLSHFQMQAKNVLFTDVWFNFTIEFVELPENGVKCVSVSSGGWSSKVDRVFYTGDKLTIQIPHNGSLKSQPREVTLWGVETGFIVKLNG